jgi:hypothetical protein
MSLSVLEFAFDACKNTRPGQLMMLVYLDY